MGGKSSKIEGGPKTVVTVGGGYVGWKLAMELAKVTGLNVTVVDSRENMLHNIAGVRAAVRPEWAPITQVPRNSADLGINFVHGWCTGITADAVSVALMAGGDETIAYDALVLATGSRVRFPGKLSRAQGDMGADAVAAFTRIADAIKGARDITIAGGGPVAAELAGEIVCRYSDKHVRIVHSGDALLSGNGFKPATTTALTERARKLGIEVVLGERVNAPPQITGAAGGAGDGAAGGATAAEDYVVSPPTLTTSTGREIATDLLLWCVGATTNSDAYREFLGADGVAANGRVIVDEHLRATGGGAAAKRNVFAVGDCVDTAELKTLAIAGARHVPFVAKAVVAHLNGADMGKAYEPSKPMAFVTLGNADGVAEMNGSSVPAFIVKAAKGKDLLSAKVWGDHGAKKQVPKMPTMGKPVASAEA
mmetsp:Transcript_25109/g.87590  ORF Transcript_25109/g.87590 Transcript_25109/m.87590 type:complete len:423 (-) Transcript_25109:121-1389(-)